MKWISQTPSVAGILTPDRDGVRVIYDIGADRYLPLQAPEDVVDSNEIAFMGRFCFYQRAFIQAQKLLRVALKLKKDWLIIDEIGFLELQGEGLEPVATQIINHYKTVSTSENLLLGFLLGKPGGFDDSCIRFCSELFAGCGHCLSPVFLCQNNLQQISGLHNPQQNSRYRPGYLLHGVRLFANIQYHRHHYPFRQCGKTASRKMSFDQQRTPIHV